MDSLQAHLEQAQALTARGDHAGAAAELRKAANIARSDGDFELLAEILQDEFQSSWEAAELAQAESALREKIEISRRLGQTYQLANTLIGLAFFPSLAINGRELLDEAQDIAVRNGYADIRRSIEQRLTMLKMAGLDLP